MLQACSQPGASVAEIARQHGLNANVVHRWRALARAQTAPQVPQIVESQAVAPLAQALPVGGFVALRVTDAGAATHQGDIRIELRRGAASATVNWPLAGAASCTAWLREWFK